MDIVQRQTTSSRWFQVKARRYVQQTNIQTGASKTRYPSPTSAWPVSSSNTHIYIRRGARPKSRDYVLVARERRSTNRSAEPWGTASVSSLHTQIHIYSQQRKKKNEGPVSLLKARDGKAPNTKLCIDRQTNIPAQAHATPAAEQAWGGVNARLTHTDLLPVAEPQVHTQLVRACPLHVEVEVLKALDELSAGALHGDDTRLRVERHAFGDLHITRGQQGLHGGRT